ncbi:NADP-dependent phosphogluconate dehydrogenase [Amylibacter sp. IMCC11727]|uniref:NADP-dependent phosphogluconate dehydrogenase n=1 Tax=Amylibacter sp. IMCC11727 TaxID=3039851 RepID=UPI00244DED38|nr:NADP-dependent phosphogluconate dehydrogenase [Amylibacter sp. IMCC11727]WGI21321.1 NADP-dependent phosphogluconate dehydrogenase [Amylibacter sp. IMCC11727]
MAHVGLVGIGVMGREFALNLAEEGHSVSLLDRTLAKSEAVVDAGADLAGDLLACRDAEAFVQSLPSPRSVLVLVPSGGPLDSVIEMLSPLLEKRDLIADLGNSYYKETERRVTELEAKGLLFLGMGISGGAEGARHGPAIMAGGSEESWARVKAPLQDASAKFEDDPCCDWFGPGGSGHFIKMLHNGIEYADMQMIAEAYGLMRDGWGMDAAAIGDVFAKWMNGPLNSYLIEIAAEVARADDPKTGKAMLDMILDKAGQKGTGRWSVIEALHLGAPIGMVQAAVEARNVSADIEGRRQGAAAFGAVQQGDLGAQDAGTAALEQAMIAAKVCAYTQGFEVLRRASEAFEWCLDLAAIARVWRAGCIIRSVLLDDMSDAFAQDGARRLFFAPKFETLMKDNAEALQSVVGMAVTARIEVPALFAALSYFNASRTERSTANMIQGLRDRFGAHTFERVDAVGEKVNGPWHD